MEKSSATFWLIVGGLVLAILYLWEKSRSQSAAVQAQGLSNPVASAANSVATKSDSILRKFPWVGSTLSDALNSPITDVTSGNVKATVYSATSGGLSDVAPSVAKYLNPVEWL